MSAEVGGVEDGFVGCKCERVVGYATHFHVFDIFNCNSLWSARHGRILRTSK